MNASPQDRPDREDRLQVRVTELEMLCTHLQRTLGELDQVVLAQQRQIDGLARNFERLAAGLDTLAAPQPPLKPEDEKPPHY
jgi:uncharacterized coiled-coil protein SlyX